MPVFLQAKTKYIKMIYEPFYKKFYELKQGYLIQILFQLREYHVLFVILIEVLQLE
nr:MAG TPA: hypothetical protein [Caudoviricetes sp.]